MGVSVAVSDIDEHVKYQHVRRDIFDVDFHLHAGCEIYFLISGGVRYFVEKNMFPVSYGDLVITNNHEIHKPAFTSDEVYERITLELDPAFASVFSSPSFDLLRCFYERPLGERNKITLASTDTAQVRTLFSKYEQQLSTPGEGSDQLKLACLIEILVLINRRFAGTDPDPQEPGLHVHHKLTPVLDYIDQHLTDNLSLDTLARELFINKYYLSKLFKQHIGSNIHEYIVYKRIAASKRYLSEGNTVMDACIKSGFGDYTSFLKTFKRTVGMLPREFVDRARRR